MSSTRSGRPERRRPGHALLWRRGCCLLAAAGTGVAMLEWSPLLATLAVLLAWGTAVAVLLALAAARGSAVGGRPLLGRALLPGVGAVAAFAGASFSPPLTLLVLLAVGLGCPWVVSRLAWRPAGEPPPGTDAGSAAAEGGGTVAGVGPGPLDAAIRSLSDTELCHLWRRTFWQLRSPDTTDDLVELVCLRQACLDELARRNPAAVHAWLRSGARASGGPERFWAGRPSPGNPGAAA